MAWHGVPVGQDLMQAEMTEAWVVTWNCFPEFAFASIEQNVEDLSRDERFSIGKGWKAVVVCYDVRIGISDHVRLDADTVPQKLHPRSGTTLMLTKGAVFCLLLRTSRSTNIGM